MECSPDSKVHGANMEPTWVLSAPDGPHVDPRTLLSGRPQFGLMRNTTYLAFPGKLWVVYYQYFGWYLPPCDSIALQKWMSEISDIVIPIIFPSSELRQIDSPRLPTKAYIHFFFFFFFVGGGGGGILFSVWGAKSRKRGNFSGTNPRNF